MSGPDAEIEARRVGITVLTRAATYSKMLTFAWLCAWLEVLAFAELATVIGFGDALSLSYIVDNVTRLGELICGFYFGTKAAENCFRGWEEHREKLAAHPAEAEEPPIVCGDGGRTGECK